MSRLPTPFPSTPPQPVKGGPDTAGADEGNHYDEVVRSIERDLDSQDWDTCLPWWAEGLAHSFGILLSLVLLYGFLKLVGWALS